MLDGWVQTQGAGGDCSATAAGGGLRMAALSSTLAAGMAKVVSAALESVNVTPSDTTAHPAQV